MGKKKRQDMQDDLNVIHETMDNRLFIERRRKNDWVVRAVSVCSLLGWLLSLAAMALVDRSSPPRHTFFTFLYDGTQARTTWDVSLLRLALISLIVTLVICVAGFLFNMSRHRRKTDKYSASIMVIGVASFIGILVFLWRFGSMLV